MTTTRLAALMPLAVLAFAPLARSPAAFAQDASHAPAAVKEGDYQIEPNHTQVGFTVDHMGFSRYSGVLSGVSGTLTLNPAKLSAARLSVTIPIASIATTSSKLNAELTGGDWFDTGKFANATFVSTKVIPKGYGTATVLGDFTLHGVTKPVMLTVHFIGAGVNPLDKKYTVGFEATGTIKRAEYGIAKYEPLIGDTVTLTIAGAFEQ